MAIIDNVVTVDVDKTSAAVSVQGFSNTLLVAQIDISIQAERFRIYGSTTDMIADGHAATSLVVSWGTIQFANGATKVALGRRVPGTKQVDTVTITLASAGTWSVDINTIVYTFLAGGSDTLDTIAQGLADAINGGIPSAEPVIAGTVTTGAFTVTARIGGEAFVNGGIVQGDTGTGTFVNTVANVVGESLTDALAAITAENEEDWYRFNIESREDSELVEANTYVAGRKKIFYGQTRDPDMLTATAPNIGSTLAATNNKRTFLAWHTDESEFFDGGAAAIHGAFNQDAENGVGVVYGKQITGVTVDKLTQGEIENIGGDNETSNGQGGNTYTTVGGRGFIMSGKSVEGEFIDVQSTIDWHFFRVQEAVFGRIATTPTKVPYTNAGIATIMNEVLGVLQRGIANGHNSPDFTPTVTAPKVVDVPTADKNARVLRNVIGTAQLAGAIQKTLIQINLAA